MYILYRFLSCCWVGVLPVRSAWISSEPGSQTCPGRSHYEPVVAWRPCVEWTGLKRPGKARARSQRSLISYYPRVMSCPRGQGFPAIHWKVPTLPPENVPGTRPRRRLSDEVHVAVCHPRHLQPARGPGSRSSSSSLSEVANHRNVNYGSWRAGPETAVTTPCPVALWKPDNKQISIRG